MTSSDDDGIVSAADVADETKEAEKEEEEDAGIESKNANDGR